MINPNDLFQLLTENAIKIGFPRSGAVDIEAGLASLESHFKIYGSWINKKHHGNMKYLERSIEKRQDPRLILPDAKSVFCVLFPYSNKIAGTLNKKDGVRYARFLRGADYHISIKKRLQNMMLAVQKDYANISNDMLSWHLCVDSAPVLERSWAEASGLGWIGKNKCLINEEFGSYFYLAFVLLNKRLGMRAEFIDSKCGSCNKCLDSCKTKAINEAGFFNSKNCTSYLTLEKNQIDEPSDVQKKKMDNWVAGCDLCQEGCPYNQNLKNIETINPCDITTLCLWSELMGETRTEYLKRVKYSALSRVKYEKFRQNVENAFLNSRAY